ncbi:MAG: orotidine-5'-phosphate decarboxylase [Bacillota bacterium]
MKQNKDRLIVALDVDGWERARDLVGLLSGQVGGFKVGMRLFYRVGPEAVSYLRGKAPVVFTDLKLHDIPSTVAGGVRVLTSLGATLINVHASGGKAMMQAAREAASTEALRLGIATPKIIAVTVLTSLDEKALQDEVGISGTVAEQVVVWARLARECRLDGVVASPQEAASVREACGPDFLIVTPGVRPDGSPLRDQRRVMTPAAAVKAGADYIVVGRPVLEAPDPLRAAQEIVDSLE